MVQHIEQGKEYEVVRDDLKLFEKGTRVIALESSSSTEDVPWCVKADKYVPGNYDNNTYDYYDTNPMLRCELKEVEDNGNKD